MDLNSEPDHATQRHSATPPQGFQAIVVGASVAGCATAILLAQAGIRVALVEAHAATGHYKKMCTHIIHPAGVDWLRQMGFYEELCARGGQPTLLELISPDGVLQYPLDQSLKAANIERKILDPFLRERVALYPEIVPFWGYRVGTLLRDGDRVTGVSATHRLGKTIELKAACVIAADGRKSRLAALDNNPGKVIPNGRVALFSYYETQTPTAESKIWSDDRGQSYIAAIPNGARTILSCYLSETRYLEIKADQKRFFDEEVLGYVKRQGISLGKQNDALYVAKDTSTLHRRHRSKGLVYVGDALLSADPLTGIGCTWAMTSAQLLARQIAPALGKVSEPKKVNLKRLDQCIHRYALLHRLKFGIPALLMALISGHGKLVFNRPVVKVTAWISKRFFQRGPSKSADDWVTTDQ